MKIVFLTRSLEVGGAEVQIVELAKGLAARGHRIAIVTFYPGGALEREIMETGVMLLSAEKRGRWDIAGFIYRLGRVLRSLQPDVIHSFLGPPNLMAAALAPVHAPSKLIWGIRASDMDLSEYDWTWRLVALIERACSGVPSEIIANSIAGKRYALANGFRRRSISVVPNGIDVQRYQPISAVPTALKRQWQRAGDEVIIGLAARIDPMKDHPNFLRAAACLKSKGVKARYVCVGDGETGYKEFLRDMCRELEISDDVIWAGYRSDMPQVFNSFDLSTQSSAFGEGFPNSVGEAMAVGIPCAVTDVGDAALIVGDTGYVVAKRDPVALSDAWMQWLQLSPEQRRELSGRARRRILENYSTSRMLDSSEAIYRRLQPV